MQFTIWSHTIRRVIIPFIGMALLAMPVYGQQQDKKQQNTVALSGSYRKIAVGTRQPVCKGHYN